ncbi:protein of unknown function [Candidatus Promineifilum breve]|uniref:DNA-binding response regulator n=1 Tax=Candidatus Promineifilum breve TaxID=1806508 RepID=A0A160T2U1_9CHLR|nr:hypothetical protein [Candidatus Promineifilum breve]CUS03228.2 protein of unknown function [Candidatus Promineifilum breve]
MDRRRVILYGGSVILGALRASLERCAELEVIPLSPPLPGAEALGALAPDVVLFDAGSAPPDPIFALLRDAPNLLLVGVDPEQADLLLWSSEHSRVVSAEDLIRVITPQRRSDRGGS